MWVFALRRDLSQSECVWPQENVAAGVAETFRGASGPGNAFSIVFLHFGGLSGQQPNSSFSNT